MATTRTAMAPALVQSTVNANPQDRSCWQRYYPCSVYLIMLSFMIIFTGAVNIGMGASTGRGLSDSFYESFPELRKSGQTQLSAGIVVLIIGIFLLTLALGWCCYARKNFSTPTMFSGTAMTTTAVSNTASTSGVVLPPGIQVSGGQPTYVYHTSQQAGSFQQVQTGTNQYPPDHSSINQYPPVQPVVQPPAPPEMIPDKPPPSYNDLMNPTNDYGHV